MKSFVIKYRRPLSYTCLVALLLVGVWFYVTRLMPRPVGSGPAGPTVEREAFAKPWTERKVLLLGVGDSITAGFGVPMEQTYFEMLLKNPPNDDPALKDVNLSAVLPNLEAKNIAISGSTSIGHLEILQDRLEKQPDEVFGLVAMTSGGNDLIHNYGRSKPREGAMYGATFAEAEPWIANYEKRLGEMLDLIAEKFPGGCAIFLGDIYDPTDGVGEAKMVGLPAWPDGLKIHQAYNAAIHRAAEKRKSVHLVPLHELFLGHGLNCIYPWNPHYCSRDPHYWYAANLEDPNARGYDAVRRQFLIEIAKQARVIQ
ncbi:MAG: SGNH/GDSL hydrolase family protein [Pirellulales bacterium]|nr:SGNH/GDSL hydrolase family protein [Pirellulales bacterium]